MQILFGCLLVLAASLAAVQSPQEFRNRYGEPDVERFVARPGIGLAVQYGSDHLACRVLIQPLQSIFREDEQAQFMSSETVTGILEEVAPTSARGKVTGHVHTATGCNNFDIDEYGQLSIARSTHNCLPLKPEREMRATVTFKRNTCASESK